MRQATLAHGEQSMGRDRNCRSSKIKAARSNRSESKVVWLHRKRVIVHCSIPVSDRDDKLVILNEQRHDVPHWHWIDKELNFGRFFPQSMRLARCLIAASPGRTAPAGTETVRCGSVRPLAVRQRCMQAEAKQHPLPRGSQPCALRRRHCPLRHTPSRPAHLLHPGLALPTLRWRSRTPPRSPKIRPRHLST